MKKFTLRLDDSLSTSLKEIIKDESLNSYITNLIIADIQKKTIKNKPNRECFTMDMFKISCLIKEMRTVQENFYTNYEVNDIWSNSKIYEIMTADAFDHILIPGHSGSRDAKDLDGNELEYKHFKESSSNHSWTFNDFSDTTINDLANAKSVIFIHIDDVNYQAPGKIDWCYIVPGHMMRDYLFTYTKQIMNTRKMINVSPRQIEERLGIRKTSLLGQSSNRYAMELNCIFRIINELEILTDTKNLLTSNKFWELLVALELGHTVNSEQGGREGAHDAFDSEGNLYEYKVSKNHSWNFQDISENVLNKYLDDTGIILAVVDKTGIKVTDVYSASPYQVTQLLREKLEAKRIKNNGVLRRLQVSLSKGDLKKVNAKKIK